MEERLTKRMEEMMAAFAIKLQPSLAEDPSCPEVTRAEEQPAKETPPSPSPLENLPLQQPTKETPTPPPSKNPEPITAQKKDHPPPSPQTPPRINPSAQTPPLPKISAETESPATLFEISAIPHHPYLKTTHRQPQNKRTKPKKPTPLVEIQSLPQ
jgi:hypothetical protein